MKAIVSDKIDQSDTKLLLDKLDVEHESVSAFT